MDINHVDTTLILGGIFAVLKWPQITDANIMIGKHLTAFQATHRSITLLSGIVITALINC